MSFKVEIDYTNWRGERAKRVVTPMSPLINESNEWHPERQWLMLAQDEKSGELRKFAMKDIHSWTPVAGESR